MKFVVAWWHNEVEDIMAKVGVGYSLHGQTVRVGSTQRFRTSRMTPRSVSIASRFHFTKFNYNAFMFYFNTDIIFTRNIVTNVSDKCQ